MAITKFTWADGTISMYDDEAKEAHNIKDAGCSRATLIITDQSSPDGYKYWDVQGPALEAVRAKLSRATELNNRVEQTA